MSLSKMHHLYWGTISHHRHTPFSRFFKYPIFMAYIDISYSKKPESMSDFKTGVWVSHSKYGRGEIVGKSGSSNNLKLKIRFDNFGTKNMIARYAPLEIIVY